MPEGRLAIESGPEFVNVDGYPTLLEQSDWRVSQRIDVTEVFAQSIRTSLHLMSARADALVETLGAEDYRERMNRRQATARGPRPARAEAGDLRRDGGYDSSGVMRG
jgi:hypothetical protein